MSEWVNGLGLNPEAPVLIDSPCYRPPSWPPPLDWVVSADATGQPVSRWGDDFFDFSLWAGISCKLHFVGGPQHHVRLVKNLKNQHILRLLATWITWAPRGSKSWSQVKTCFGLLRRIVVLCDEQGSLASELVRFPQLLSKVPGLYKTKPERKTLLTTLDRLLRSRQQLGFSLIDEQGLTAIAQEFAQIEDEDTVQTAYIPPRIWSYQVLRLRECLDSFLEYKEKLQDCYNFCVDAYAHNFGSLEGALFDKHSEKKLPFCLQLAKQPGLLNGRKFYGSFEQTARRFGIEQLLRTWVVPPSGSIDIRTLSAYFSLVEFAGHAYIANFTLQRSKEVAALRADCLVWEQDPVVGRIAIICGETTKTDPDSDARWPTSPSVSVAVEAMTSVC